MLWLKGWMETRFRLLLVFLFTALVSFQMHSISIHMRSARAGIAAISYLLIPLATAMICAILAGAGIATQSSLQASKGLHGSTLFTLSMPVSRLRLLAVRAGIGWLEAAVAIGVFCWLMWVTIPLMRGVVTPIEMMEQAATLIACSSTVYFIGVLMGTVFDDLWRVWGTMLAVVGIWQLCTRFSLPSFVDIFHGMGKYSPIVAHTIPWNVMAFSLGLSAVLFFAALKIAQRREY